MFTHTSHIERSLQRSGVSFKSVQGEAREALAKSISGPDVLRLDQDADADPVTIDLLGH